MRGLFGLGKKKEEPEVKEDQNIHNDSQRTDENIYIVQYDRKICIGAGVCAAVDAKHWEMAKDAKAVLKGSKQDSDNPVIWTREISESELEEVKRAAEGCPPSAIHIFRKDTGEKIV